MLTSSVPSTSALCCVEFSIARRLFSRKRNERTTSSRISSARALITSRAGCVERRLGRTNLAIGLVEEKSSAKSFQWIRVRYTLETWKDEYGSLNEVLLASAPRNQHPSICTSSACHPRMTRIYTHRLSVRDTITTSNVDRLTS